MTIAARSLPAQRLDDGRASKAAAALSAIDVFLRSNQTPSFIESSVRDEFHYNIGFLKSVSPQAFTRAWRTPLAYLFSRVCYESLHAAGRAKTPNDAALEHLGVQYGEDWQPALVKFLRKLNLFCTAAALNDGVKFSISPGLHCETPFTIPSTGLTIAKENSSEVQACTLFGTDGRSVLLQVGSKNLSLDPESSSNDSTLCCSRCPKLDAGEQQILMQPYEISLLRTENSAVLTPDNILDFQRNSRQIFQAALQVIQIYAPEIFAELKDNLQVIIAKPRELGGITNVSDSHLPGLMIASLLAEPYELADTIIHEYYHNRLFYLDELEPLLIKSDNGSSADLYSPARDDLRPILGVWHALYVYLPVFRYWAAVYEDEHLSDHLKSYAADRLARFGLHLKIFDAQVDLKHEAFTEAGDKLRRKLHLEVEECFSHLAAMNIHPSALPAFECDDDGSIRPVTASSDGRHLNVFEVVNHHIVSHCPEPRRTELLSMIEANCLH